MTSFSPFRAVCVVACLVFATMPKQAVAQDYPSRPLTIVVSFAAGGFVDTIARLVGQKLSERLGHPVVIENRPGAGGNLAHRFAANAAGDGYTLLATSTAIAVNESLYKNRGYRASDFSTIAIVASTPEVLVSNAAGGPKTLREVLELSKQRPVTFGTAGVGSASYILTEYFFKEVAKGQATHIPFPGGTPTLNAIVGNQIDLAAAAVGGAFAQQIQAGTLRGLAVASEKRSSILPDMPTYGESGYPGVIGLSWVGFFAPAKTPSAIVAKLNVAIQEIMKEPSVLSKITPVGYEPMYGNPSEADAVFKGDIERWRKMVDSVGLRID